MKIHHSLLSKVAAFLLVGGACLSRLEAASESQKFVPLSAAQEAQRAVTMPASKPGIPITKPSTRGKLVRLAAAPSGFSVSRSGGIGGLSESFSTGNQAGILHISYQMYTIRDGITVTYGGQTLINSGLVQGAGGLTRFLDGSSDAVNVVINAPTSGTAWNFDISFTPGGTPPISGNDGTPNQEKEDPNQRKDSQHADPVDTGTGAHVLQRRLMTVQGARALTFDVDYDSILTVNGPVGRGWSHNFEAKIVELSNGKLRLQWNSKRANNFAPDPTKVGVFVGEDDRTRFDKISKNGASTTPNVSIASVTAPAVDRQTGLMTQTATINTGGATLFSLVVKNLPAGVTLYNKTGTDANGNPVLTVQNASGAGTVLAKLQYYNPKRVFTGLAPNVAIQDASGGLPTAPYVYQSADQTVLQFDAQGRLIRTLNSTGQINDLLYEDTAHPELVTKITERVSNRSLVLVYNSLGKLVSVTDPLGRISSFSQDLDDRLLSIVLSSGGTASTETYSYNATAQILTARSQEGVTLFQNTYDGNGRVSQQRDALGNMTSFAYDETTEAGKLITTVTDRNRHTLLFKHDDKYRLVSRTDQNGNTTTFDYDQFGNRTGIHAPLSRNTLLGYDAQGNLNSILDPAGQQSSITYDARRNIASATNPAGKALSFGYDGQNNLTSITDPFSKQAKITYGANGLPSQLVNPLGGTTNYTYLQGLPAQVQQVNGTTLSFQYDANGRITRLTNPGGSFQFTYDLWGNIATVTDPLNRVTSYTYDSQRRQTSVTDALGKTTTSVYDGNGNLIRITDALGNVTNLAYDAEDRLSGITNARGKTSTLTYDNAGYLLSITDPLGNSIDYEYDAANNVTGIIDGFNVRIAALQYDARKLPTRVTDSLGRVQQMQYNNLGLLSQYADGLSRTTKYAYDDLQRLKTITDALNQDSSQTFDASGNPATFKNAKGNSTAFSFDNLSRLTASTSPSGRKTTVTYNSRNLVQTASEPSGQTANFTYDAAGQLTQYQDPAGTIAYTYDGVGRVLTVVEGGKTITREYDALGRVTRFVNTEGEELRYAYDQVGNLTRLTYPDGKQVNYTYDDANRMASVTDWANRVTTYSYDANGRVTAVSHANGTRRMQTFDAAGQLTAISERSPADTAFVSFGHTYDLAGQLTQRTAVPALAAFNPAPATMSYDADDRLTGFNIQGLTYDTDGNMTAGVLATGAAPFAYDARNRLTSAGGVSSAYDAENRRLSMTTAAGTTRYTTNPVARLSQLLVKRDPSGTMTRYVYGLGLLYEETGGATRTYHYDHLGSTVALTDAAGAVTGRVEYGPYGEISASSGNTATPLLFNGRYGVLTDPNGLYHMRARFYSPQLRRFINEDPIGLAGGANRYAYADGNPISFIDPFGLAADDSWWNSAWNGITDFFGNPRVQGALQTIGGAGEFVAGVGLGAATSWTGIGAIAGGAVALHGADQFQAGLLKLISGQQVDTFTSQGIQGLGVSQKNANLIDGGISIVGTLGASAWTKSLQAPISFNPTTASGPLPSKVVETFRSGTYTQNTAKGSETFYRVHGGQAGELGSYWSRTPPSGPIQATIDSALNPQWGNTATNVATIQVPKGTAFFEGAAAPQGGLVGGGNQIYIPTVNPNWLK